MCDPSIHHRFCCSYVRTQHGDLVSCTGPFEDAFRKHWNVVSATLTLSPLQQPLVFPSTGKATGLPRGGASVPAPAPAPAPATTTKSLIQVDAIQPGELVVYERRERESDETAYIFGISFQQPKGEETSFNDVFASLLLNNIKLFTSAPPPDRAPSNDSGPRAVANAIADVFDARLRHVDAGDKWASQGREYFFGRVFEFVRRAERLEFCLPAFPCKSSHADKVFGVLPDRGEQIALENLHSFVEAVERIYQPGAKLWIVSDGHVFSDCIGVDDKVVDRYNAQLISMNAAIGQRRGGRGADRIGFKSLVDLFGLDRSMAEINHSLQPSVLPSYIATQRTPVAELSRQLLDQGCKTAPCALRARIESGSPAALKLYRGFSRFMLEDLSCNRYTQHLSRSQLRKLAPKVAFEMMQRNDAYSRLVELIFPNHVRLSIHAHDNAGPKFGVRLCGPGVQALEALSLADGDGAAAEASALDLLHVPTPWHNCLVEVSGYSTLVMIKSKAVRDALSSGKFAGSWVEEGHQGVAGHFRLRRVEAKPAVAVSRGTGPDSQPRVCSNGAGISFLPAAAVNADMAYMRPCLCVL